MGPFDEMPKNNSRGSHEIAVLGTRKHTCLKNSKFSHFFVKTFIVYGVRNWLQLKFNLAPISETNPQ